MNRRQFLRRSAAGIGYCSLSSAALSLPIPANAASHRYFEFVAEAVTKSMTSGVDALVWQYTDMNQAGLGGLGSSVVVRVGDSVTISLTNQLDRPIDLSIKGILENYLACPVGKSIDYNFTPRKAGVYLYRDKRNQWLGQAMGLAGPLVVLPSENGAGLNGGSALVDQQFVLFFNEYDTRLNEAMSAGSSFDMSSYEPNYFFVNGLSFPGTLTSQDTYLDVALNSKVAIRLVNGGLIYYPVHFHGYHVDVVARNGSTELDVVKKDTLLLDYADCVDTILSVNQQGQYPIHSHYMPAVTGNGVYPMGSIVLMNAV